MTEGTIVRIVDDRTLIAGIGMDDGVKPGQQFVVVQPVDIITDPESGVELGTWEMVKARVIAEHVQAKLTTLVPIGTGTINQTVLSEQMAWGPHGTPIGASEESLNVDRAQVSGRHRTETIRIGDVVRSVG
jgi:hypothetical protein